MAFNFSGIGEASAEQRRPKLDRNGTYAFKVNAIKYAKSFETGKYSYVIELTVLESSNPEIGVDEDRSITINRLDSDKKHERVAALGNLKGFLAAVFSDCFGKQIDPKLDHPGDGDPKGWEKLAEDSMLDDGAGLEGAKVRVKIFRIETDTTKAMRARGESESAIDERRFALPTFFPYSSAEPDSNAA